VHVTIRAMQPADWSAVRAIYAEGIATGNATFETTVPTWEVWDQNHLPQGRLIATREDHVLGWAALLPVSNRPVYAGVCEVSVYVAASTWRQGIGTALLAALIRQSEGMGIWTLQAGIFPENVASLALHRACGFRRVGIRKRLGQLHGTWRDVVLMERRSKAVGTQPRPAHGRT
jgi:L-amino acid N-acyltransferase YncA